MGFWSRMFGRKPTKPTLQPTWPVRDSWSSGDLGECIANGDAWVSETGPSKGPQKSEMVRVAGVLLKYGHTFLWLEGYLPCGLFEAGCFRKLTIAANEACDADFAKLIRKSSRKVGA